jgi:hypothetical protein
MASVDTERDMSIIYQCPKCKTIMVDVDICKSCNCKAIEIIEVVVEVY